jgi:hypothetical protein
MRRSFWMMTVAGACLAFSTGLAAAQGPQGSSTNPSAGGTNNGTSQGSTGRSSTEQKSGAGTEQQKGAESGHAQMTSPGAQNAQQPSSPSPSAQSQGGDQSKQRAQGAARDQGTQAQGAPRDQGSQGAQRDQDTRTQGAQQAPQGGKPGGPGQTQTGTAGANSAGSNVTLNTEQRTKIRETVINAGNAPKVSNVNFAVNVGTVVPRSVHIVSVPDTLVEIQPAWRGHLYFIVGDQIVIVEPGSLKIVAILPV